MPAEEARQSRGGGGRVAPVPPSTPSCGSALPGLTSKKAFPPAAAGVKARVGRAGAHSSRVTRCRRWGAGAPCSGAEQPRHPTAPATPVPSPPRHDPATSATRMKRCCPGAAWVSAATLGCPDPGTSCGVLWQRGHRGSGGAGRGAEPSAKHVENACPPPPSERLGLGSALPRPLRHGTATGTMDVARPQRPRAWPRRSRGGPWARPRGSSRALPWGPAAAAACGHGAGLRAAMAAGGSPGAGQGAAPVHGCLHGAGVGAHPRRRLRSPRGSGTPCRGRGGRPLTGPRRSRAEPWR